jgi:signal transduction histidine kinase
MSETAGKIGLGVFGAVTASISHEIKNRMAVINEHAGLMEDHIHMAEKGIELNIERFQRSAEKIKQQVSMADEIIANMNRFAHSADKAVQQVDLNDAAALAAALFQRTASAHEISLHVQTQDAPVTLDTSFFHVLALIWICLKAAMTAAAAKSTVTIACGREENKPRLVITLDTQTGKEIDGKLPETANIFAAEIKAQVGVEPKTNHIVIEFL